MKTLLSLFTLFLCISLSLNTGCGKNGDAAMAETDTPVTEITITGDDRMRFAPTRFTVRAGHRITLTLDNIGRMPKESMGHNLVILDQGVAPNAFAAASVGFPQNEYIAPQFENRVIAATTVLGPGEQETITFIAPATPGEYPFVCSFPGHTQARMVGIMIVIP
ncbi:MAG: cupredoxin domain-containing protein [Opitutales bacterium]|nr:cupredoxin domain-containing protein [Opitutales bacterium]